MLYLLKDSRHPVENVLLDDGVHKWLCATDDKSGSLTAEFQLERMCLITHIDIGKAVNNGIYTRIKTSLIL